MDSQFQFNKKTVNIEDLPEVKTFLNSQGMDVEVLRNKEERKIGEPKSYTRESSAHIWDCLMSLVHGQTFFNENGNIIYKLRDGKELSKSENNTLANFIDKLDDVLIGVEASKQWDDKEYFPAYAMVDKWSKPDPEEEKDVISINK